MKWEIGPKMCCQIFAAKPKTFVTYGEIVLGTLRSGKDYLYGVGRCKETKSLLRAYTLGNQSSERCSCENLILKFWLNVNFEWNTVLTWCDDSSLSSWYG